MTANLLMGIDIGTQGVKGVVVRLDGKIIAQAALERGPNHPHPGWVEMDVEEDIWGSGVEVIKQLLSNDRVNPKNIAAIGVSGLVPCLCPVGIKGIPLRPMILYSDNRALRELDWVNDKTGLNLNAQAVLPKLVWMRNHEVENFSLIQVILSAHNYFVLRLTDKYSMDPDTAAIMGGVYDPQTRSWRKDISEKVGVPARVWAPIVSATSVVGRVTKKAASATGLIEDTPVIAGSGDSFPTIVGCGAVEIGDAMVSYGTTGLLTVTRRPLKESAAGPHFDDNAGGAAVTWGANILSSGRMLKWFVDQFGLFETMLAKETNDTEYNLFESRAELIPPGSENLIVLPHLLGRRTPTADANMRGAVLGLEPSHTRSHVYRALLESFAFNVRQNYEDLKGEITRIVVTAGGARSPLWRQIMADVLNASLEFHPGASGALGIAFLAGYGLGLVGEFETIKYHWLTKPLKIEPNPQSVEVYNRLFPIYCDFDQVLADPFSRLAAAAAHQER